MEFGGKVKKRRKEQKEVVSIKYQILSWKRKRKMKNFHRISIQVLNAVPLTASHVCFLFIWFGSSIIS